MWIVAAVAAVGPSACAAGGDAEDEVGLFGGPGAPGQADDWGEPMPEDADFDEADDESGDGDGGGGSDDGAADAGDDGDDDGDAGDDGGDDGAPDDDDDDDGAGGDGAGPPNCGDSVVDANEECDDGNADNTDTCLDDCTLARCGDGFVFAGFEECDDGNGFDSDGCSTQCEDESATYDEWLDTGIVDVTDPVCYAWAEFREDVGEHEGYTRITMSGSNDPVGVSCTGLAADQLCWTLSSGEDTSVECDGETWTVGPCGGGIEITTGLYCNCDAYGYAVRPCMGSHMWGGIAGDTCGAPSQALTVSCDYG